VGLRLASRAAVEGLPAGRVARLRRLASVAVAVVTAVVCGAQRRMVGGQAVLEGVMMRGVDNWSLAVRKPDGDIWLDSWPLVSLMKKHRFYRLPVVRGVVALVESLIIGVRSIQMSANLQLGEDEAGESQELSKKELAGTLIVALVLAVALFFLVPLFVTGLFTDFLGSGFAFWFVEGLVRVAIFVGYLAIVTRIPDLRRVFEYHGAEHMSIHALEHGDDLTPPRVETYTTLHVRCGTSFLLIVMVVSIMVFAFVGRPAWYLLILSRVILIPLIAGVSYELIRLAGRFETNRVVRAIMLPGLMLQWMTTKRPDDSQVEVAIAALQRIIELEPADRPVPKGVEVMA
jgi:uncharacterized protein YqhQ